MEDKHITDEKQVRINEAILAEQVRLIDEQGKQIGIVDLSEAQQTADNLNLDLVEIVQNVNPPVCRIMDYGKYQFGLGKKRQAAKKKQKHVQVKEVKFRPGTEEGDYQVKIKKLLRFLANGDKVKVTLLFRGREMVHQALGRKMLQRIENDLKDVAIVDQESKQEGRQIVMVMSPKR